MNVQYDQDAKKQKSKKKSKKERKEKRNYIKQHKIHIVGGNID